MIKLAKNRKVFVIGRNKTGTTSMGAFLAGLGYRLGDQSAGELLFNDWTERKFSKIIRFCKSADAFQDIPFCLDYTYQILDHEFPDSRFILTVRNTADEWFNSLLRFHANLIGNGRVPTVNEFKNFNYQGKGWLWNTHKIVFNVDDRLLYDKQHYINHYELHNKRVKDYFKYKDNLLVVNITDKSAVDNICNFLGMVNKGYTMPHLMKSDEIIPLKGTTG